MLMKKLVTLILVLAGIVGTASAGTEITVYYAIPTSVTGYDNVKLNVNHRGWGDASGDWWQSFSMSKTSKTYFGKYIYSCTYDSPYNGVGVMQIQLYNGESQVSLVTPFACTESNKFLKGDDFNGKMWEHDNSDGKWRSYNYDKTVTIHCKKTASWTPTKCHNYFNDGVTGDVPETSFPGNGTSQSTLNSDWYDYTITGRPCTTAIMNNGYSGTGNQSGKISIGDEKEYWVTYDGSTTTCETTPPASFSYSRDVTSGNFGTICLPYAATVEGATIYEISSAIKNGSGELAGINLSETASLTAGVAYIFKATSSTLTATLSGNYTDATAGNYMVGNLSPANLNVPLEKYVVSGNKIHKVIGGGSGVTVGQYRGYLDLSTLEATSARGLNFISLEGETTGIDAVKQEVKTNGVFFNLAGQRVAQPTKGLYIVNGKKVIMK